MKVRTNRPTTSTPQMEARASKGVSSLAFFAGIFCTSKVSSIVSCSVVWVRWIARPTARFKSGQGQPKRDCVLPHDPEHAIPTGKTYSIVCLNFVVSEFIILLRFRCRWPAEGEVDDEGPADNILHGHEAPVAAVAAVVAIVSQHKIAACGYDKLAIVDFLAHLHPPMCVHSGIGVEGRGKLIAEGVASGVLEDRIRLRDGRTVNVKLTA